MCGWFFFPFFSFFFFSLLYIREFLICCYFLENNENILFFSLKLLDLIGDFIYLLKWNIFLCKLLLVFLFCFPPTFLWGEGRKQSFSFTDLNKKYFILVNSSERISVCVFIVCDSFATLLHGVVGKWLYAALRAMLLQ